MYAVSYLTKFGAHATCASFTIMVQEYYSLEECMGENDRKWAKCREQIAALKQCNTKKHPSGGVDVLPK